MAETLLLEVATPERLLVREQATEAQIPAADGCVGILPGPAALLAELGAGTLSYAAGGHRRSLSVEGGWLESVAGRDRLAGSAEVRYGVRSDRTRTDRTHHAAPRA